MNKLPQFQKYGKIPSISVPDEIEKFEIGNGYIFEKIDGGNCQVRKYAPWKVIGGSKANYLTGQKIHKREWFQEFCSWMRRNTSLFNLPENLILFGEWSGNHSIDYDSCYQNRFFFLDLFDVKKRQFISYMESLGILNYEGVSGHESLPVLFQGRITPETLEQHLFTPSNFYKGPKEGLVIKQYNTPNQSFLKLYHPEFAEKLEKDGRVDLLTPARFRKNIFSLVDESEHLRCSHDEITRRVIEDIKAEEHTEMTEVEVMRRLYDYLASGKLLRTAQFVTARNL